MKQEAAQELLDRKRHEPLLVAMSRVSPAKGDVSLGKSDQSAIRDGNAMRVVAKIAQHMFWPSKRPLGIDGPVMAEQYAQPGCEGTWLCQGQQVAAKLDSACMKGAAKSSDELAVKDAAEDADGQEEGVAGRDPA